MTVAQGADAHADNPGGVPLSDLSAALSNAGMPWRRDGDNLIVQNRNFITHLDVLRPSRLKYEHRTIKAVARVKTELPDEIPDVLKLPCLNAMASVGALTEESGSYFIGSRLTLYENEEAHDLHYPLLLWSVMDGADAILSAMGRMFRSEAPASGASEWAADDLAQACRALSRVACCTAGDTGLTAEFPLKRNAISALFGHHDTALWQMMTAQPHPELGGGLLCLLDLPHRIKDKAKLDSAISELNRREMAPDDLPLHFGAWCEGNLGNNPAYVSFLPNALHCVTGIATNFSIWAYHRARWANAVLPLLGAR